MNFPHYLVKYIVAAVVFSPLPTLANDYGLEIEKETGVQWSYKGVGGPGNWGVLSEDFRTCSDGGQQSPINIQEPQQTGLSRLEISYEPTPVIYENTGQSVNVHYDVPSYFDVGGVHYNLDYFHFHVPSENRLNGKRFAAEVHFVHKGENGKEAVLSVFILRGKKNKQLQKMIKYMPRKTGEIKIQENRRINASNFLPSKLDYYRFVGSQTMPPCTEGVQWFVLKSPISASKSQIKQLKKILGENARPVQNRNNRLIIKSD